MFNRMPNMFNSRTKSLNESDIYLVLESLQIGSCPFGLDTAFICTTQFACSTQM